MSSDSEVKQPTSPHAVELLISPRDTDLGEFSVRRLLPTVGCKRVGPWVFFDHMGPAEFAAGEGINVRPHPHINLATVTYLFDGEILHRDSLGTELAIHPGDINLMVAGSGIVHSERERPEVNQQPHGLHGLQLWLALPVEQEEIAPAFYHYAASDIPELAVGTANVRVMMGSAYGQTSPVLTFAETLYLEAQLTSNGELHLPDTEQRALYVLSGEVELNGQPIAQHQMAIITTGTDAKVVAKQASRIALIGGEDIGPRFIDWNFVSSRKERIEQARHDWREQRFDKVPNDEVEFIPLPD